MTNNSMAVVSTVGATLASDGWVCTEVRPSWADVVAWCLVAPDQTVRLVATPATDGSIVADLTGHPVGHLSAAIWTLTITDPDAAHLIAVARAAAADRLRAVLSLANHLEGSGWKLEADESQLGALCQMTSARSRTLTRLAGTEEVPGGWVVEGDGLRGAATDGVPIAVLAVLAAGLSEATAPGSVPVAYAAERPEAPEPDAS